MDKHESPKPTIGAAASSQELARKATLRSKRRFALYQVVLVAVLSWAIGLWMGS